MIPTLLGAAVLLPLFSFLVICLFGPRMGKKGEFAGLCATLWIFLSCFLSMIALIVWLTQHAPASGSDHAAHASQHAADGHDDGGHSDHADGHAHEAGHGSDGGDVHAGSAHGDHAQAAVPPVIAGNWYSLGRFGNLELTIGYYIDSLTVAMFCMVTLIALCIHLFAIGYMQDELEDVHDHEVVLSDGSHLHRPGRFPRFFQYLSLFCFSMLGLVVAGNIAMTFVFWELVGICSYFLIGFYIERKSASNAANKAFIVNRVGDFGMIIGLMVIWSTLGTFQFGDVADGEGKLQPGMFSLVRPGPTHALTVPDGMVRAAAIDPIRELAEDEVKKARQQGGDRPLASSAVHGSIEAAIQSNIEEWRHTSSSKPFESNSEDGTHRPPGGYGYGLLILAGLGIFCGCVGKSAQFPLHVWLPDAMEGPTPVSALVHSATMVAAGVFLVARFYPMFAPEVLLVIAIVGMITLFLAATIAITATDIKRVLAYSTVSQLGYMMLALGVGGWLAGVMHLFTHAFFKSLLFLCSGSVIHAVHTNEMPLMGGLRKKMPWTAYTMLVGCLAIAGAGIPFVIGFSGYYSKDSILEQAFSFQQNNPAWGPLFFGAAALGAAITAFYMFRMWYLTFAGTPRDAARYEHAHESPPIMVWPLVVLALFAVVVAWSPADGILGSVLAGAIFGVIYLWRGDASESAAHGTDPHHGPAHGAGASPASAHAAAIHGHPGSHSESHHNEADGDGEHAAHHGAHGSGLPRVTPLVLCVIVLLLALVWSRAPFRSIVLSKLLEQARPAGTLEAMRGAWVTMEWPNEHDSHAPAIRFFATTVAFFTALAGFLLATMFYGLRRLDPRDVARQFSPIHRLLLNKWWFDELYHTLFVRPTFMISQSAANFDRRIIDRFVDGCAYVTRTFSDVWERVADQSIVDGFVNRFAQWTYAVGLSLRRIQTGRLRDYVMFIAVGAIVLFLFVQFLRNFGPAPAELTGAVTRTFTFHSQN